MQINSEYCATLVREADRDRYLAALFAPAAHRDALFALYAFNVELSRVRDLAREPMPGEIRLQWWREALSGERSSEAAAHPVAAALLETIGRHGFSIAPFIALIDAHAFDLYDEPLATIDALETYAAETEGRVLAISAAILGATEPLAVLREAAIALAIAGMLARPARWQGRLPLEPGGLRALAQQHLRTAQAGRGAIPAAILPALLPVALLGPTFARARPLSSLHRQWLIWRAARDPSRIFRA